MKACALKNESKAYLHILCPYKVKKNYVIQKNLPFPILKSLSEQARLIDDSSLSKSSGI